MRPREPHFPQMFWLARTLALPCKSEATRERGRCASTRRTVYRDVLPAALTFAQRARARATSRARPAAESLRFLAGLAGALPLLTAAQRARCAALILAIPAALIFFRFGLAGAASASAGAGAPSSWLSSSWRASIRSLTSAARRSCLGVRFVNVSIFMQLRLFRPDCQPWKVISSHIATYPKVPASPGSLCL